LRSLDYLIALARGNILERSRAVSVTFSLQLSPRSTCPAARMPHRRSAHSRRRSDRQDHRLYPQRRQRQAAGLGHHRLHDRQGQHGDDISAGTPDYVDAGYVDAGYQTYTGATLMPIAGEVTYGDFSAIPAGR
jgi:hypothetical protein